MKSAFVGEKNFNNKYGVQIVHTHTNKNIRTPAYLR
jgi:hypothetical protein